MENGEKEHGRRRHQRGPLFTEEKDEIEANAKRAGAVAAGVTVIDS